MEPDRGVKSIQRAFDLLTILAERSDGTSLGVFASALNLPKSTIHRILGALAKRELVRKDEARGVYFLGLGVFRFSQALLGSIDIALEARPFLEHLNQKLDETVHLGIMDRTGRRVVYIDKIESTQALQLVSGIGQSVPLHSTSLGKAMLACLSDDDLARLLDGYEFTRRTPNTISSVSELLKAIETIRIAGFATDCQENEPHVVCVGAAIRNQDGELLGALSVSGLASRISGDRIAYVAQHVQEAARQVSEKMSLVPLHAMG